MGSQIIKVAKDRDLYLDWVTYTDSPVFIGDRRELSEYLNTSRRGQRWPTEEEVGRWITTADQFGSSSNNQFGCCWDSPDGVRYQAWHTLHRAQLPAFADRLLAEIEKNPEVRWGSIDFTDLLEDFRDD